MAKKRSDQDINPADLPQREVFIKKEVFQHPQPADGGKALRDPDRYGKTAGNKPSGKTVNEEGLNEEKSSGDAGAFEGLEDQGDG